MVLFDRDDLLLRVRMIPLGTAELVLRYEVLDRLEIGGNRFG